MSKSIYSVNFRDRVCWLVGRISSFFEQFEVWKHEWYHVVTNCLVHIFGVCSEVKKCSYIMTLPFLCSKKLYAM